MISGAVRTAVSNYENAGQFYFRELIYRKADKNEEAC